MEFSAAALYLALGVLSLLWFVLHRRKLSQDPLHDLPGPTSIPFFGNLLDLLLFNANSSAMLLHCTKKFGKVWRMEMLGKTMIIVVDPNDIAKVSKSTKRYFKLASIGDAPMDTRYGINAPVLFDLHSEEWKRRRVYAQRAFDQKHTKALVGSMSDLAVRFADRLEREHTTSTGNAPFDMMVELRRMMMTAMNMTILGDGVDLLAGGTSEVAEAIEYTIARNAMDAFMPWFVPLNSWKLKRSVALFSDMIRGRVEQCSAMSNEELAAQGNITALLVLAGRDEAAIKLSNDELMSEMFQYCVAGFDTSKCSLGIFFYHMAMYPEIQAKVREEVNRIAPGGKFTSMDQISELKYLSACIDESTRIQPIVPIIDRVLEEDIVLHNGRTISAGNVLFMGVHSVHLDPEVWGQDSLEFRPERHLQKDQTEGGCRHRMGLIPFGVGPKRCVGFQLASMQVRAITAAVLSRFEVRCAPGYEKLKLVDSIVLEPRNLRMVVKRVS